MVSTVDWTKRDADTSEVAGQHLDSYALRAISASIAVLQALSRGMASPTRSSYAAGVSIPNARFISRDMEISTLPTLQAL
jgi:hypothetical protein